LSIDCVNPSTLKIWQIEWIKHRALEYYTDAKSWLENGEISLESLSDAKIDFQSILDFFNESLKNIPSSS
jgi:hypothetical protein